MSAGNRNPEVLKPQDESEAEQCPFCTDTMQNIDGRLVCLSCGWEAETLIKDLWIGESIFNV